MFKEVPSITPKNVLNALEIVPLANRQSLINAECNATKLLFWQMAHVNHAHKIALNALLNHYVLAANSD